MPVQWFLAYRIRILSHSWIVFGGICILSLAQGGCGIAGGVLATILSKCVEYWIVNPRPPEAHTPPLQRRRFQGLTSGRNFVVEYCRVYRWLATPKLSFRPCG